LQGEKIVQKQEQPEPDKNPQKRRKTILRIRIKFKIQDKEIDRHVICVFQKVNKQLTLYTDENRAYRNEIATHRDSLFHIRINKKKTNSERKKRSWKYREILQLIDILTFFLNENTDITFGFILAKKKENKIFHIEIEKDL
jgi:hypothetical protein